ncbi:hypothetical protein RhiirA5_425127 [Rhizophagus irregularis]|uniref:Protein kinase domain-containing protein n=1 Tax=Rhizophagus irregularis TaxID=588596 RepID=A0A2N0P6N1_9GLOM|nr:hypothetical protein RhiirA5_425127 [Rhizophagus irregularis]PKC57321.1 hypothetical protein RhiirA1_472667 [Rhizophagus irregularis]
MDYYLAIFGNLYQFYEYTCFLAEENDTNVLHRLHIVLADKILTNDEKTEAVRKITKGYESLSPAMIVEWIPYNYLKNINYLTKGGFSKIYTADWINGIYSEWDSKEQQLKRFRTL